MRVVLKDFQSDDLVELLDSFADAHQVHRASALLLNAPTGAGKTLMATAFIEAVLDGTEESPGDPSVTVVWLTDQPELNKQTREKMLRTSSVLTSDDLIIIDGSLDAEALTPGRVYFLNTQKLATTSSLVRAGDDRTFTLWATLANTVNRAPDKFLLVVDEAHRGTKGNDAAEAESIMQKFLKGSAGEIPMVPLVVGISATPDRFRGLCADTNRPLFAVDVDPERVRESGLLKEYVDLYHPEQIQPGQATMLTQAVGAWREYASRWSAYGLAESEQVPRPVLLVQVEDARAGASGASSTDLGMVVATLAKELGQEAEGDWLAHAFQDDTDLSVAGHTVRHLAPSAIDDDPDVKVVLFKTSLNTGWDCPRAEVMVSFRRAKDETNIAQLVGRMVRAPLARRIDADEHLNTVALYLPFYDRATVEKVVNRLTQPDAGVPPTSAREGEDTVTLTRAADKAECFELLERLPTETVPRVRPTKPVPRVARLAALLAEMALETDPVKTYRGRLVQVLMQERERLSGDADFKKLMDEGAVLDIRLRRVAYGTTQAAEQAEPVAAGDADADVDDQVVSEDTIPGLVHASIAEQDLEDLSNLAGKRLGEGLHKEYIRDRLATGAVSARVAKLEVHALVATPGVATKVDAAADAQRREWVDAYKATINAGDERYVQALREIEAAGSRPETTTIVAPQSIEWSKAETTWKKHLYVGEDGTFPDDFAKSSWERRVVETETARDDIVGWFRNPDRKPWSLCIARQAGMKWVPFYPDFILFRRTPSGIIADIVDPHLLSAEDMPQRAVELARYAQDQSQHYGRIEMVLFEGPSDQNGKRLDLSSEAVRAAVANVATSDQLKALFASV